MRRIIHQNSTHLLRCGLRVAIIDEVRQLANAFIALG